MNLFLDAISEGKYWIAMAIAFVSILLNIQKVTEYYFYLRKNRQAQILAALQEPLVSSELKSHLRNELDIEYFKSVYGVRLSTPMLNAAYFINKKVEESVSFRHVLKVIKLSPDITGIESPSFRIKVSLFETLMKLYNLITGVLIIVIGFIGFICSVYIITTGGGLSSYMMGIPLIPIGFYMFNDGVAFFSVRYINQALEDYEQQRLQSD